MNKCAASPQFPLNRRHLLAGGAATLAGLAAARDSMAQTPKRGGHFRLGVLGGDTAQTLDPANTAGSLDQMVQMMTRSALVEILPNGDLGPELAERWDSSEKFTRWTFQLRRGVTFHDGRPFSSADVVFSVERHLGDKSRSPLKSVLGDIKEIRADGADKVVMDLKSPNADFPYVLSDYYMRIVPAGTTNFLDGMGTGPYVLTTFEPGVRATGKRNPNYFKSDRAHFDQISLLVVPDESARIAAMRAGDIDAMDRLSFKVLNLVQNISGVKVLEAKGRQHFTLPMLADQAPFDNLDARLAMKYAVDREAILKLILGGHGSLGNDQPISSDARFFNTQLPQRHYDPDKAKFHIRKAGLENQVFSLHASEAAFAGSVDLGTLVKESASKAGININLIRDPNDGYWSKVWQKVPWFSSYWAGRPTEDWMLTSTYAPGPFNESHWANQKFNELLVAARGELDIEKRRQMYWEMQQIISDDGATVIPVFANYITLISDKIAHGPVSAMWILDGYKATERWWFA